MLSYYTDSSGLQNRLKYEVSESIEFALEEGRGRLEKFLSPIGIKAPIDCFKVTILVFSIKQPLLQ